MSRSRFKLPWASKRSQQGPQDPGKSAQPGPAKAAERKESQAVQTAKIAPIRSIGVQLFLFFVIIVIAAVATVGYWSFTTSRKLIETQVQEASRLTAVQAAEKLQLMLDRYSNLSLELMLLPEISDLVTAYRLYSDDKLLQLESTTKLRTRMYTYTTDTSIYGIYLIPIAPGLPPFTTGNMNAPDTVKETEWWQAADAADGSAVLIPTAKQGPSGVLPNSAFGIARKVKDTNVFTANYMLLLELKETKLQETVAGAFGDGSSTYIVDDRGMIVSAPNDAEIGQPLGLDLPKANDSFLTVLGGEEILVSYSKLSGGWALVGVQPYRPLVEGTNQIRNVTIWSLILGAIAAALVGLLIYRRIGMPLNRLSALMKKAGEGDLSIQTQYAKRGDEIGLLAAGFNDMIANIRSLVEESNKSAQDALRTAAELGEASRRTATSAKEIAVATEQIAVGASNVAIEAEKVADVTTVMGSRMAETTKANEEMAEAAAQIRRASQQGTEFMQELSEKTSETEKLTQSMVRKVEELQKSTRSIRDILDLLNNITKQTNILSLNATIEAARAGEAGRGFMVVADEIRKLADQSKHSIETVGAITDNIRSEIDDTVRLMEQAYPLFQEQIASVKQSNDIFVSVNDRMGEFVVQLEGVSESVRQLEATQRTLSEAMSNVSAVAEESSATSEEVASLTSEQLQVGESLVGLAVRLEEVSKRLSESLSKFRL